MAELFTSEDLETLSAILERELGLNLRSEELTTAAVSIVRFACAKMLRQKSLGKVTYSERRRNANGSQSSSYGITARNGTRRQKNARDYVGRFQ